MPAELRAKPPLARRAVISGRVQGVFFRDSLRRLAEQLGVAGWARNRPDGTVELWAEGPAESVEQLLSWSRSGPPQAHVREVAVEEADPSGMQGFQVR